MLIDQIDSDLKKALKDKDEVTVSSLRNLKAALKNFEIAARPSSGRASPIEDGREKKSALTDEEVRKIIGKKVKQHKDSIESFKAGNREDLVNIEVAQMKVLEIYLPKQMDETELTKIVVDVITTSKASASDFGKVMKEVVSRVKGQADGNIISKIVKENLN